jgi:hypothetical protein
MEYIILPARTQLSRFNRVYSNLAPSRSAPCIDYRDEIMTTLCYQHSLLYAVRKSILSNN